MTSFVPVLLAKLTLILALGLVVIAALRSFSPSLRHLILFATIASGLVLPLAMWMSPQWNVALLPRGSSTLVSPSDPAVAETSRLQHRTSLLPRGLRAAKRASWRPRR